MTDRIVALLVSDRVPAAPPGVDADAFGLALIEDTYEVAAGLQLVTPALVLSAPERPEIVELTWPGTPVLPIEPDAAPLTAALTALAAHGAQQVVVLAADAPDLPPLLIGKLFRGLGGADVAVCPAEGGGLVALGARLPAAHWIGDVDLETPDALERLRAAAPTRRALSVGPGWHRLRAPADVAALDPGLEGWPVTRALLAPGPREAG